MYEIRGRARQLMRLHRMAARTSSQLEPLAELKITADYLLFQLLCQLVVFGVWLRGPVALHGVVSYVGGLCGRLSEAMAKPMATEGRELHRL
jgi:hypothetical protein